MLSRPDKLAEEFTKLCASTSHVVVRAMSDLDGNGPDDAFQARSALETTH